MRTLFAVEFASNINNYLTGGVSIFTKTKEEAEQIANATAVEKFRQMEEEAEYSNLEFVNNGIYTTDEYTEEMRCLYIVTVREVEIPE